MIPPAATASTTAADVQLAAVPSPTTRVGRLVSTARACSGTAARPAGLPAEKSAAEPVTAPSGGALSAVPVGLGAAPSAARPDGSLDGDRGGSDDGLAAVADAAAGAVAGAEPGTGAVPPHPAARTAIAVPATTVSERFRLR
ncbi:hypothetical protein [Solwaraspora sp. WMMD406]|uniref:hypothetical protein n=1 Tax=Solwaraspora sp. WMMD406 TaxID=3016095 RepID=UPI0032427BBD